MNPLKLTFTANEQDLTKTDNFTDFASNTVSYIEATFTLGENWSGYDSVRAVWKTDYYTISTVLDANFTCIVPTEVLRYKAKVFVNLVGSIVENDTLTDRLTTFPVLALTVKANAAVNGSETAPVTPSQFEQFVDSVRDAAGSISDYSYDSEAWAVGTRGGVNVPSTDPTFHNNSKYWAEQNAGLADEVADLKSDFNTIGNIIGEYSDISLYSSASGWRLNESNGLCSSASDYKLDKYKVTEGQIIKVISDDRFQFQNSASVPDSGTSNRIGNRTYGAGTFLLKVPPTATHLIISTLKVGSSADALLGTTIDKNVDALEYKMDEVSNEVGAKYNIDFEIVDGEYIGSNLETTSSDTFSRSTPIQVSKGDIVRFNARGYLTYVSMITLCDANGDNRRNGQTSIDSTVRLYELTIEEDGYIIVSFNKNYEHTLTILSDKRNSILDKRLSAVEDTIVESNLSYNVELSTNSGFIDSTGAVTSHPSFIYSQPFQVYKGQIVEYTAKGYSTNVALLSEYVNGTYNVIKISTDSDIHTYKYTAEKDCLLVLSSNASIDYGVKVTFDLSVSLNKNSPTNYMTMFHKIGVIGDSLASGEIVRNNDYTKDRYAFSWLANIGRRNGVSVEHYSKGGITAKAWTENNSGLLDKFNNDTVAPALVYIALGTNDKSESYPVGTSSDSSTTNSFCGYMKKIIETVKAKNPNALICLVSLYSSSATSVPYSNAIKDLANANTGCYYVDYINNCGEFDIYTGGWDIVRYGHFTTTAYVDISEIIEKLTNKIVDANRNTLAYFGLDNE